MEQTELKFEVTLKTSYTKDELGDMPLVWIKRAIENMIDDHCEFDSYTMREII